MRHLIYINAILMFMVLYLIQLFTDSPILSLLVSRFDTIIGVQALHAAYQYFFQGLIIHYGFLEHDDYHMYFSTYDITPFYAVTLPLLSYTATVIFSLALILLYKQTLTGGWLLYNLFSNLPKRLNFCRRYSSAGMGLLFMAMFGAGFLMNLYYLFVCAAIVLHWSMTITYTKLLNKSADLFAIQ